MVAFGCAVHPQFEPLAPGGDDVGHVNPQSGLGVDLDGSDRVATNDSEGAEHVVAVLDV